MDNENTAPVSNEQPVVAEKKHMPDNLYKMSVLETNYSEKKGNIRCTLICALADNDYLDLRHQKARRLLKVVKQHPNIKVDMSDGKGYPKLIITETAFCAPEDTFDETVGRHVAETKARITLNRLMREFTLAEIAHFVNKGKEAAAWYEEYDRRTGELIEHFDKFSA